MSGELVGKEAMSTCTVHRYRKGPRSIPVSCFQYTLTQELENNSRNHEMKFLLVVQHRTQLIRCPRRYTSVHNAGRAYLLCLDVQTISIMTQKQTPKRKPPKPSQRSQENQAATSSTAQRLIRWTEPRYHMVARRSSTASACYEPWLGCTGMKPSKAFLQPIMSWKKRPLITKTQMAKKTILKTGTCKDLRSSCKPLKAKMKNNTRRKL